MYNPIIQFLLPVLNLFLNTPSKEAFTPLARSHPVVIAGRLVPTNPAWMKGFIIRIRKYTF